MVQAKSAASFAINVLEDHNGRILLLKRHSRARLAPGLWGFPAGHVEPGESPEECAWRELREEVGTRVRTRLINHLGPMPDCFQGGIHEVHIYHHQWLAGRVYLNYEHTDHAWVDRFDYANYPVMDGVDADLYYLAIWPTEYLHPDKLPIKPGRDGHRE